MPPSECMQCSWVYRSFAGTGPSLRPSRLWLMDGWVALACVQRCEIVTAVEQLCSARLQWLLGARAVCCRVCVTWHENTQAGQKEYVACQFGLVWHRAVHWRGRMSAGKGTAGVTCRTCIRAVCPYLLLLQLSAQQSIVSAAVIVTGWLKVLREE